MHVTCRDTRISISLATFSRAVPIKAINLFFKMTDQARWKATIYVGGLAPMVTAANLEAAFLPFGEIADVSLP
jgi:hypothetical protein